MTSNYSNSFKRPQSLKRFYENESVILLEKNLNNLKRNFIELDHKLKTDNKYSPPAFYETASSLSRLNTKLFIEKENLEKKAISTLCQNARLEEKVNDFRVTNSILTRELDQELNFNKKVISENLELKSNLRVVETQNRSLSKKLDEFKSDVKVIEQIEVRKSCQLRAAKEELDKAIERNKYLSEKLGILESQNRVLTVSVDQLKNEKEALNNRNDVLEKLLLEKEQNVNFLFSQNDKLENEILVSKKNLEAQEQHNRFLETEKKDLLASLSESYKQENNLLLEISVLRDKVFFLERKNSEFIDNFRRFTS